MNMIRQSQTNRSSFNSEFQKSMLSKLDSLTEEPTFDSVNRSLEFGSPLSLSNASSNGRRRRLYQSPGVVGVLQSPDAVHASVKRQETVRSMGSVLAERAKLVRKALTRNSGSASTNCSTPLRKSFIGGPCLSMQEDEPQSKKFNPNSENIDVSDDIRSYQTAGIESASQRISKNPIDSKVTPHRSRSMKVIDKTASRRSRNTDYTRILNMSTFNESTVKDSIDLAQFRPNLKKVKRSKELARIMQMCSLIRNIVNSSVGSADEISQCRCLQRLIAITKKVETSKNPKDWFPGFSNSIMDLMEEINKCGMHKRFGRAMETRTKINATTAQSVISKEVWATLSEWIRSCRPLLLDRLASNIHKLM